MDQKNQSEFAKLFSNGTGLTTEADPLTSHLWRQLQGLDLHLDRDTEPFMVLAELALQRDAIRQLSRLVSVALGQVADGNVLQQDARALYNLLHLCIELRQDLVLGAAVWRLYDRQIPQGNYRGARLPDTLRGAMIYNQPPRAVRDTLPFWRGLIEGNPDFFVGGRRSDGFRGAIRSMTIREQADTERLNTLAECFRSYCRHTMDLDQKSREAIHHRALDFLMQTYPALHCDEVLDAANLLPEFAPAQVVLERLQNQWMRDSQEFPFLHDVLTCDPKTVHNDNHILMLNRAYASALRDYRRFQGADVSPRFREVLFALKKLLPHAGPPITKSQVEVVLKKAAGGGR